MHGNEFSHAVKTILGSPSYATKLTVHFWIFLSFIQPIKTFQYCNYAIVLINTRLPGSWLIFDNAAEGKHLLIRIFNGLVFVSQLLFRDFNQAGERCSAWALGQAVCQVGGHAQAAGAAGRAGVPVSGARVVQQVLPQAVQAGQVQPAHQAREYSLYNAQHNYDPSVPTFAPLVKLQLQRFFLTNQWPTGKVFPIGQHNIFLSIFSTNQ